MKKKIKNFLSSIPFVRSYFHGQAIILMLHRIAPLDCKKIDENEGLKVDPKSLETFILEAKKFGYRFLSLDDLYENLLNEKFIDNKNIVITLDDGYKDNYLYGFPIFERYSIPFCIYLCTSFLSSPNMWWYSLENHLLKYSQIEYRNKIFNLTTKKEKSDMFMLIRSEILLKSNNNISASNILQDFGISHDKDAHRDLALSVKEIQIMLKSTLFTLGCHTHSHPVFNNLTFDELRKDIFVSISVIEKSFGITPQHFCFPFGGVGEISKKYCDFIKEFGFKTAVTTREGTIYKMHKNYTHILPRIFISGKNFEIQNLVKCRKKRIKLY